MVTFQSFNDIYNVGVQFQQDTERDYGQYGCCDNILS
jgi:hypothetical protein